MKMKKILLFLLAALVLLPLCACSDKETATVLGTTGTAVTTTTQEVTADTDPMETAELTTATTTEYSPYGMNPFTGIKDMDLENVGKRSVSVVINNTIEALPQRGITKADAIYEYETEGGQTRLLALYADVNTIPEVGSLRSARIIACDLSDGTNSIFVHYGKNARVPDRIAEIKLDHLDGNNMSAQSGQSVDGKIDLPKNIYFWRDNAWKSKRATEHTAVTNGTYILKAIQEKNISWEGETPMLFPFDAATTALANGEACNSINVFFSNTNDDSLFTYVPETGLYLKSQYTGKPQIDETTGEQIAVKNVIVLYANIVPHGDTTIDAYLTDGGTGYYVAEGKLIPIKWSKAGSDAPIVLKDNSGTEISVLPGKCYINIVRKTVSEKTTWK